MPQKSKRKAGNILLFFAFSGTGFPKADILNPSVFMRHNCCDTEKKKTKKPETEFPVW